MNDDDFYRMLGIENDPRFEQLRSWEHREREIHEHKRRKRLKIAAALILFAALIVAVFMIRSL